MDMMPKKGRDRNILYAKIPINGGPPATFKMSLRELLVLLIDVNNNEILNTGLSRLLRGLSNNINEKLSSLWGVDKNYTIDLGRDEEYEQALGVGAEFSPQELGEALGTRLIREISIAQNVINNTNQELKKMDTDKPSAAKYDKRLYTYGELGATPPEGKTAKDVIEAFTDRTKKLIQTEVKTREDVDLAGINIMQGDDKIGILFYKIVALSDVQLVGGSR